MKKILIPMIFAVLVPLGGYLCVFMLGYFCFSPFIGFVLAPLSILIFSLIFSIKTPKYYISVLSKICMRICIPIVLFFVSFYLFPPTARIYSQGFNFALITRTDLAKIQHWAQNTINKYAENNLEIIEGDVIRIGNLESPGIKYIDPLEVPDFLKKGLFASSRDGPTIEINTEIDKRPIVKISWYVHGILIGDQDYKTSWEPWYIKKLKPGIYTYHVEK